MKSFSVLLLPAIMFFLADGTAISDHLTEEWVALYDGLANDNDRAECLAVDVDGNVYVTGKSLGSSTDYDYATIKYNSDGVEQWVTRYDGPTNFYDIASSIALDGAGNVYVTGYSDGGSSATRLDYATIKYNNDGVEQWVARYDGPINSDDLAYSIALDGAGNVYVTGRSMGNSANYDYATLKYSNDGVEQWIARYDGPTNSYDHASSIALDGAGNVYVTGRSMGNSTNDDYTTIKYSNDGVEQWVVRYDGQENGCDIANSIALDGNGNAYVTGISMGIGTRYDYATIKYNSDGAEQWVARYDGPSNSYDLASSIALDGAGNVYVTGESEHDYATIKYSQETGIEETEGDMEFSIRVYPCPVSITASVTLSLPQPSECSIRVFGLDGRLVETLHSGTIPGGEHTFLWQTSQVSMGVYLLRVRAGSMDNVSRLTVIH